MPSLTLTECGGRVRLDLGGFARGEGGSLQEAADDLVCAVLRFVMAFRAGGLSPSREVCSDFETFEYVHELGEIAAAGGDIRPRLFG